MTGPVDPAEAERPETEQAETERAEHPTAGLDDVVHQRHRLGILTIAAETKRVEFGYLREALDLTAGNLSRHITVLSDAGLLSVDKGYQGRRPRTWVRITPAGRAALAREMASLRALLSRHDPAGAQPG
jgi:DNA-binding MarR family transcriptional regulator